jgi:hypothetical protein
VSGADPVDTRPGFARLLAYCQAHGIAVVLVENASRFARDLAVQLTGHALLRARIELVPADAPSYWIATAGLWWMEGPKLQSLVCLAQRLSPACGLSSLARQPPPFVG